MKTNNCAILSRILIFLGMASLCQPTLAQNTHANRNSQSNSVQGIEHFVDSLLTLMTLEEKLGQLAQFRWNWSPDAKQAREEYRTFIREGRVGSFLGIEGVENTLLLQRIAVEESRLGIPLLFAQDIIHGYRTIFPVPLAEASSWEPQAAEQSARIAAIEATAAGLHWTFAPMVDIARDPRWGRIVEGAGEDPYLGSVMAAARVRGFQGQDLSAANTMLACAKHFAAYGGAEGGRDYNTVDVSERTLREIYLPPFHAAVKAGVATIMVAFNEIGGIPMHANSYLINDVLRGKWGFKGLVVSDYTGIMELQPHGVAATPAEAGVLGLNAGVDIDMVSAIYKDALPDMARKGSLAQHLVDEAVRRVLRAKYLAGLFEDPYRYCDTEREKSSILTPEHIAAAREVARKSIVLLKNTGKLLPLSKELKTLAVIGPLAEDMCSPLGSWAGLGRCEDVVTALQGIKQAVSPSTKVIYAQGCKVDGDNKTGFQKAVDIAKQAEAVVLVLGEHRDMSGESQSRSSLDLPGVQRELAQAIYATGKPTVAVLMNGRPLSITWLAENIPAILESWFLGVQTGPAIADVLFGDYNPGGKLPVSFPRSVGQVPIYYNHKNTGRPGSERMWTSKYRDLPIPPLFLFGHGLSYTEFTYGNLRLSAKTMGMSDTLTIWVDVKNSGDRYGEEVVQLYIQDEVASVTRPVKELRGFQRIGLDIGQTKSVSFRLSSDVLAFYNPDMQRVVEPGSFKVFAGTSSKGVLEAQFEVVGEKQ